MIENDVFNTLKGLVANRVYPSVFPQVPDLMTWPAIRYQFVSTVPGEDICGYGGDDTAEVRIQIDAVAKTFNAVRALRLSIMQTMETFSPPAILTLTSEDYDEQTKTHRSLMDFTLHPSSSSSDGSMYADNYAEGYA